MKCTMARIVLAAAFSGLEVGAAGQAKGDWLAAGQTCSGTKASCDGPKFILQTALLGPLHGAFNVTVSAGDGVLLNPDTALLQWTQYSAVGTFTDVSGNAFPTSVHFSDLGDSTATLISTTSAVQNPIGPYTPPATQINQYFFEFDVSTPFGLVVLENPQPWVMTGIVSGFPPEDFNTVYTQMGSVDLVLYSGPPEISDIVPVGSVFGSASGAVVTVQSTVPEPPSLLLFAIGSVLLSFHRIQRLPSRWWKGWRIMQTDAERGVERPAT